MTIEIDCTPEKMSFERANIIFGNATHKQEFDELERDYSASRAEYDSLIGLGDETAIFERMRERPPYFMDPVMLTTLPLYLLGVPAGCEAYNRVMRSKVDLRARRAPQEAGGKPLRVTWKDYTDLGWPKDQGVAERVGSPEEHEEILRRLKVGSLTKPGSEVALKSQTLASLLEEDTTPPPWIIEGLLRAGGAMLVFGPSGIGKSWFVHTLMLMATHGRSAGIRDAESGAWVLKAGDHEPIKVALIDGEMIKEDIAARDTMLCGALGLSPASSRETISPIDVDQLALAMEAAGEAPEDIELAKVVLGRPERQTGVTLEKAGVSQGHIDLGNLVLNLKTDQNVKAVFPDLADPEWKARVVHYALENGIKVLVFDNLSTLCPSIKDENAAAEWTPFNDLVVALKHAGVATIFVHHTGKSNNDFRGSSNIVATMETSVSLEGVDSGDLTCEDACFKVQVRKHRSHGTPLVNGKVLRLSEGEWRVEIDEQGTIERVARLLRTRQYTKQAELGKALNLSQGSVSKLLAKANATKVLLRAEVYSLYREARELRATLASPFEDDEELEERVVLLDI